MAPPSTRNRTESRLYGRIAAYGVLDPVVQRMIPDLAKIDPGAVTRAVVRGLLVSGVAGVKMPPAVGEKTPELVAHALYVAVTIANTYHANGGALTVRGVRLVSELIEIMHFEWVQSVPPRIDDGYKLLDQLEDEEKAQRMALAAQAICTEFLKLTKTELTADEHVLDGALLEAFCVTAARVAVTTFDHPNEYIHTRAHGALD